MLAMLLQMVQLTIEKIDSIYRRMMQNLAKSILGDYQLAEDAVQESLIKIDKCSNIIENLESNKAKNFIYTVTKNTALTMLKKRKHQYENIVDMEEQIENIPGSYIAANHDDFGPEVSKILDSLKEEDKDLVVYRFSKEYSIKEIEKITGMKQRTIYDRLNKVERIIKEALDKEGKENNHE